MPRGARAETYTGANSEALHPTTNPLTQQSFLAGLQAVARELVGNRGANKHPFLALSPEKSGVYSNPLRRTLDWANCQASNERPELAFLFKAVRLRIDRMLPPLGQAACRKYWPVVGPNLGAFSFVIVFKVLRQRE